MAIESFAKIKRNRLVQDQVPAFVANEHQTFVKFLEAYYEFLSEKQFVTSERFVDYLDVDSVPEEFLTKFWEEVREIPGSVISDKRLLSKYIRDLYASKGTRKSIELLFRILFNENIEIYEPKEDMLRASNGKWVNKEIIRTRVPIGFDLQSLNGKKLYQYNDFQIELCQFIVADVSVVNTDQEYLYIEITPSTLVGRVFNDRLLYNKTKTIALEIVQSFAVSGYPKRGSNYKSGDVFFSGLLPCYVETVGTGSIDGVFIIEGGSGYSVGDYLTIDENDTTGTGLSIQVTEVGVGGDVREIRIINVGSGYEELPKIPGNGTGKFYPYSSRIGRILSVSVKEPSSTNAPINASTRAIVSSSVGLIQNENLIRISNRFTNENGMNILSETGERIIPEETISSIVVGQMNWIDDAHTITIKGNFGDGNLFSETDQTFITESGDRIATEESNEPLSNCVLQGEESGVVFDVLYVNQAKVNSRLEPIYRVSSRFVNDDGFVSQPNKKIQDSLFYQDFSYVIKSAQSFENYKNILYKMIHPAGMAVFGEVRMDSFVLRVTDRIKKAFDELKLISNVLISKPLDQSSEFKIKTESRAVSGASYEFIEKYKFILGGTYQPSTYGASGYTGAREFNRILEATGDDNWKISDFGHITFEDMYEYLPGYGSDTPLTLIGNWTLNGFEQLDGVMQNAVTTSFGKYRLRNNKKITKAFGVEIYVMPAFPIEDEVTVTDSITYQIQRTISESLTAVDSLVGVMSFNYSVSDSASTSDNVIGDFTINRTINETATAADSITSSFTIPSSLISSISTVDQVTLVGMDAPKDSTSTTDVVSWVLGTNTGINETSINSGPL